MVDSQPVKIKRRQTRALLFFLAGSGGMLGRSELIEKFFSGEEISDDVAHRRLRELISKLRSDLPDEDTVLTANDQVGLNPSRVEVDVVEFERLYRAGEVHLKKHVYGQALPTSILPTLESALALWHGSDFLQGLILENQLQQWQIEKNAHLTGLRENLLKHLAGHAAATNDLETAAHWLRTTLEPNQYSNIEDVYHLMQILKIKGQLNEALKLATLLKKRYEADRENMPADMENLCRDIINQFSPESNRDLDVLGKSFFIQTRLVGRQKELARLQSAYREKQAAIIWGESGMGKSRLVHEFYRSLPELPQLMVAACRQMEQNQPFDPLMDMLEQCMAPADWETVDPQTLGQLASFIPDTLRRINHLVPIDPIYPFPEMVNEALYRVLKLKAAAARVLIYVENVQWCDESSLNALAYLFKKDFFKKQGFLVVSGLASEKKNAFDVFINSINRQDHPYEIIFLNALKEEEVSMLAQDIIGTPPSKQILQKITAESGGNPFILTEYLKWHLQQNPGESLEEMLKNNTLPTNVSSLMRARLRELDPQLRQVINAAAVVGEQFTLESIAVVAEINIEEAAAALERLEDLHLIKTAVKFDPIGGFTYTYPRMRQLVINEIKTARKQLMYRRIANFLESRSGQRLARPGVLAQYFQNGGEQVKAFNYWFQAAENAFHLYSLPEASFAFKSTEALLLRHVDLFNDEQIGLFLSLYVDYLRSINDFSALARITRTTLDFGQQRSSHLLVGMGLRFKALFEAREGRMADALAVIADARRHLEQTVLVHELLRAYNVSGILYNQANQLVESRRVFEDIIQMAEKARSKHSSNPRIERELSLAEDGLAVMEINLGLPQMAARRIVRAIDGMEMSFDYRGLTHAQTTQAEAFLLMGSYPEALQSAARALQTVSLLQGEVLTVSAQLAFAQASFMMGHLDDGWKTLEKADEICNRLHMPDQKARIHIIRGTIFRVLDAYEKALEEYQAALSLKCAVYTNVEARLFYGLSLRMLDRREEGSQVLKEALEMCVRNEFLALKLLIDAAAAVDIGLRGNYDHACQLLEDLAEQANQRGLKQNATTIYYNYSSFMLARGNLSVARSLVQSLVGTDNNAQAPWALIRGLILLERINRREGRYDETFRQRLVAIIDNLNKNSSLEPLKTQVSFFIGNIMGQMLVG